MHGGAQPRFTGGAQPRLLTAGVQPGCLQAARSPGLQAACSPGCLQPACSPVAYRRRAAPVAYRRRAAVRHRLACCERLRLESPAAARDPSCPEIPAILGVLRPPGVPAALGPVHQQWRSPPAYHAQPAGIPRAARRDTTACSSPAGLDETRPPSRQSLLAFILATCIGDCLFSYRRLVIH